MVRHMSKCIHRLSKISIIVVLGSLVVIIYVLRPKGKLERCNLYHVQEVLHHSGTLVAHTEIGGVLNRTVIVDIKCST